MTIRFAFPRAVAAAVTGLFLAGSFHPAEAHISYSGRDFGTVTTGSTISGQAVSSSFGWADATDLNWGDSHRMRAYRFTLSEPTSVTITAQRQNLLTGTATGQQTGGHDVLLPAFSLYAGLSHPLSPLAHDSSTLSVEWLRQQFGTAGVAEAYTDANANAVWDPGEAFTDTNGNGVLDSANLGGSGKEGSFNALGDWSIGNSTTNWPTLPAADPRTDSLRSFTYVGHAADGTTANYGTFGTSAIGGDGVADGTVSQTFLNLAPGDYSLLVGGAGYAAQGTETTSYPTYGVSVTVVPEPAGVALVAAGLAGVACVAARRRR